MSIEALILHFSDSKFGCGRFLRIALEISAPESAFSGCRRSSLQMNLSLANAARVICK